MAIISLIRPNAAVKNLAYYLQVLRELPCTASLDFNFKSGFAVCTHTDSAFENWVYWPAAVTRSLDLDLNTVHRALDFFKHKRVPFVWPVLGSDSEPAHAREIARVLKNAGLYYSGRVVAMNWNAGSTLSRRLAQAAHDPLDFHVDFQDVKTPAQAEQWADAAWSNFGGEAVSPEAFRAFARAMSARPDVSLTLAQTGGLSNLNLGTFMLVNSKTETGVYYFATAPEARRRGVAASMMHEIGRRARAAMRPLVVLQATPAGVPFYDSAGFVACQVIPVYSTEREIFD